MQTAICINNSLRTPYRFIQEEWNMNSEATKTEHLYSETPDVERAAVRTKWLSLPECIYRLAVIAIIGAILLASFGPRAFAKSGKQAASQPSSEVDPHAIDALKRMGGYLRSLQAAQVQAELSTDEVMDNGMIVQSSSKANMLASKPNRLRIEVNSDAGNRLYLYDGKSFTVWGQNTNYYATVPAPPTISELIDRVTERFDIDLPLVDLFRWGTDEEDAKKIKAAVDVGISTVEGVTCEQYTFHQDDIDWQIWIQLGQYPLPRKLVIRTLTDEARPQHSEVLSWNLAPSFNDDAFVFDPPPGAQRIVIAESNAQSSETKK
jgi:hypothetical protein